MIRYANAICFSLSILTPTLFQFCAFFQIILTRLQVGHTHEDIDSKFGQMWRRMRAKSIRTAQEYEAVLKQSLDHAIETPHIHDVFVCWITINFSDHVWIPTSAIMLKNWIPSIHSDSRKVIIHYIYVFSISLISHERIFLS